MRPFFGGEIGGSVWVVVSWVRGGFGFVSVGVAVVAEALLRAAMAAALFLCKVLFVSNMLSLNCRCGVSILCYITWKVGVGWGF